MDILEVELLKEQYDIIESSGVLHHMNDPSQGLKKLLGSLKKDGFLKLGLYSELARKDMGDNLTGRVGLNVREHGKL